MGVMQFKTERVSHDLSRKIGISIEDE